MVNSGPATSGSKKGSGGNQQNEEQKKVSCIVNFRPCKDWRGEYGFDWVRKGPKDYEERIDASGAPATDYQLDKVIEAHMGRKKFQEWRRKLLFNIISADDEASFQKAKDEFDKARTDYVNSLDEDELVKCYDPKAWHSEMNRGDEFDEAATEKDQGCKPMEYAYPAKFITYVKYIANRKAYGNVWLTDRLDYEDMANGSHEIQDSERAETMDCFVNIKSHVQSLFDKGKGVGFYAFPYYSDTDITHPMPSALDHEKLSAGAWVEEEDDLWKWTTYQKVIVDEFLHGNRERIKIYEKRVTAKVVSFTKFADTDHAMNYTFKYVKLQGKLHTAAEVDCVFENEARICRCHYVDGELYKIFCGGKWRTLQSAKKNKKLQNQASLVERMAKEVFPDRLINNKATEIEYLLKINEEGEIGDIDKGVLDNIKVIVNYPECLEHSFLTEFDSINIVDEKTYWGEHLIETWEDRYLHSFRSVDKILVSKDGKEEKYPYSIPVLSVGLASMPRKRLSFRGKRDAPKKTIEPIDQYKIQLRIEGDCPKLRFDSNNRDAVLVEPWEMENPKDHDEIVVKMVGNTACWPTITAVCIDESNKRKVQEKEVGYLNVHVEESRKINIGLIEVRIDGQPHSSRYRDSIQDNLDIMNNVFSQAGFGPCYRNTVLNVTSKELKSMMKGSELNFSKSQLISTFLDKKAKTQLKYAVDFRYSFLFYLIDKGMTDNILGYSSGNITRHIVISNAIAYSKCEVATLAHELLHALDHPHVFQLNLNSPADKNPFCFPIASSSNIMDYYTLQYSLHQYQWDLMQRSLDRQNEEVAGLIEDEKEKLKKEGEEWAKKHRGKKRKRIII